MRILHCFNWKLIDIIPNLERIKDQRFDAIQINPIQPLKEDGVQEWWMSYQPISFKIGNYFGTKEDLKLLCGEASKYDIRIFADVVINHMGADERDNFKPHSKVDPCLLKPEYWKNKTKVKDWKNRQDVIHNCIDLPGLNVYNKDVEDMIVKFLNELVACGVTGFRFDAAKSIGLPSEGYRFWPNIIYRLDKYGLFLYGEVIFEENRNILDEYANYMYVLGNYDCSDKKQMVKYVESHDTFLSEGQLGYTKLLDSSIILNSYCSLVNYFDNTLFYIRPFDDTWKSKKIKEAHRHYELEQEKVLKYKRRNL